MDIKAYFIAVFSTLALWAFCRTYGMEDSVLTVIAAPMVSAGVYLTIREG